MTREEQDTLELLLAQLLVLVKAHHIELRTLNSDMTPDDKLSDIYELWDAVTNFFREELLPTANKVVSIIHRNMGIS